MRLDEKNKLRVDILFACAPAASIFTDNVGLCQMIVVDSEAVVVSAPSSLAIGRCLTNAGRYLLYSYTCTGIYVSTYLTQASTSPTPTPPPISLLDSHPSDRMKHYASHDQPSSPNYFFPWPNSGMRRSRRLAQIARQSPVYVGSAIRSWHRIYGVLTLGLSAADHPMQQVQSLQSRQNSAGFLLESPLAADRW